MRKVWAGFSVFLATVGILFAQTYLQRPLNPQTGLSAGVSYVSGGTEPAAGVNGEVVICRDCETDSGPELFVWDAVNANADKVPMTPTTYNYTYPTHNYGADTYNIVGLRDGEMTASQWFLPTQAGLPADAGAAAEAALASDLQVVCYRAFYPQVTTITEAVLYEYQVSSAGSSDFLGFAIYEDADAGTQLTTGATVYGGDGAALVIDVTDVTIYPGWYRFCACQNDVSAQDWAAIAQTAVVTAVYNETVSEIRYGIATEACTGDAAMPTTTGVLATTAEEMFIASIQSN